MHILHKGSWGLWKRKQKKTLTKKKLAYNNEYNRQNYRSFSIRMNRQEEKHIINWLEKQKGLKQYIISLIEKDMREKQVN